MVCKVVAPVEDVSLEDVTVADATSIQASMKRPLRFGGCDNKIDAMCLEFLDRCRIMV